MRSAYLDDADPEALSHAVRGVIERRGALVTEHRPRRVRFGGYRPHAMSWARVGYVGIYQALGEREAEVRLLVRAKWPWRLLWTVCIVNVVLLLFAIVTNPPGTVWSMLAILGGLALVAATVLYVGTLKSVREDERGMLADFEAAFEALGDVDVETDEERELRELEAELEGEITKRKLVASRPAKAPKPAKEKGKRFSLRPGKKVAEAAEGAEGVEETPEQRRERLLARKAELEAKLREKQSESPPPAEESKQP